MVADERSPAHGLGKEMAKAAAAQEPSMEEILASIRRIISDEDAAAPAAPKGTTPTAVEAVDQNAAMSQDELDKLFDSNDAADDIKDDDVLELTEEFAVDVTEAEDEVVEPAPEGEENGDFAFVDAEGAEDDEQPVAADPVPPDTGASTERLLSPSADTAVQYAFGNLAHTILSSNPRTLEDLVQEMLRPMLKTWLDQNLPPLVERLVR